MVIAALRSGWHRVSLATGDATPIAAPEQDRPGMRFNDGAVDARGRFWTGTLHDSEAIPAGRLHRLDPDGSFATPDAGFLCSNGIDWSPDDRWMYFVDSRRQAIYRYPFDVDAGSLGPRELWVDTSAWDGIPDGLAVDADGLIWCAFWDGAAVHAFAADGTQVRSLEVPVRRPTSVAFGGADLRTLYLTSASKDLSDDALARWPESGKTLALPDIAEGRAAGVYGQRTR